jgi:hypothetical protein
VAANSFFTLFAAAIAAETSSKLFSAIGSPTAWPVAGFTDVNVLLI